jgi:hypothetical protein
VSHSIQQSNSQAPSLSPIFSEFAQPQRYLVIKVPSSFRWCGVFLQEPPIDNFQRGGTTLSGIYFSQQALCPSSNPSETVLLAFQCSAYFSVASLAGSPGLSPSTYSTAICVHFTFLMFHLSFATLTITTHPQDEETRVYDAIDAEDNHPRKQSQKLNSIF